MRYDTWDLILIGTMLTLLLACIIYALYEWWKSGKAVRRGWIGRDVR